MSTTSSSSDRFRFADLLPELRNIIYSYVLADSAPSSLPLLDARKHAPNAAITAVSRSLRSETLLWHQEALRKFHQGHTFTLQTRAPNTFDPVGKRNLDRTLQSLEKAQAPGLRRFELVEQYDELSVSLLFEISAPGEVAVSHQIEAQEGLDADGWVQQSMKRLAEGSARSILAAAKEAGIRFFCAEDPETLDVKGIYCAWLRPFGVVVESSAKGEVRVS